MGSVPRKQQPNPFVETVYVQSAPMDNDVKHGKRMNLAVSACLMAIATLSTISNASISGDTRVQ